MPTLNAENANFFRSMGFRIKPDLRVGWRDKEEGFDISLGEEVALDVKMNRDWIRRSLFEEIEVWATSNYAKGFFRGGFIYGIPKHDVEEYQRRSMSELGREFSDERARRRLRVALAHEVSVLLQQRMEFIEEHLAHVVHQAMDTVLYLALGLYPTELNPVERALSHDYTPRQVKLRAEQLAEVQTRDYACLAKVCRIRRGGNTSSRFPWTTKHLAEFADAFASIKDAWAKASDLWKLLEQQGGPITERVRIVDSRLSDIGAPLDLVQRLGNLDPYVAAPRNIALEHAARLIGVQPNTYKADTLSKKLRKSKVLNALPPKSAPAG